MSDDTTNPKDLLGVKKAPLRFVPPALMIEVAPAMANGAAKYGPYNWRDKHVKASIYGEAIERHLFAWMDGEDLAPDSGVKHLAHIGACIAIILDAEAHGALIDDRAHGGPAAALLAAQDHAGASTPVREIDAAAAEFKAARDRLATAQVGLFAWQAQAEEYDARLRGTRPWEQHPSDWDLGGEG
jgi:hypothetical protein